MTSQLTSLWGDLRWGYSNLGYLSLLFWGQILFKKLICSNFAPRSSKYGPFSICHYKRGKQSSSLKHKSLIKETKVEERKKKGAKKCQSSRHGRPFYSKPHVLSDSPSKGVNFWTLYEIINELTDCAFEIILSEEILGSKFALSLAERERERIKTTNKSPRMS